MSLWIASSLLVSVFAMKISSWLCTKLRPGFIDFVFLSPVLSTASWVRKSRANLHEIRQIFLKAFIFFLLAGGSWSAYLEWLPTLEPSVLIQSYCALIPLYLLGQFLSIVLELLFLLTGWHYPAHFQYPYLSKTLTEFWGRRWASWVADWLRQIVFQKFSRRPIKGLLITNLISGMWHEILINVPLFLVCHVNVFGTQLLYFLIQTLGIIGERKMPLGFIQRVYLWLIILVPAPLVINEGVLRVSHLFVHVSH